MVAKMISGHCKHLWKVVMEIEYSALESENEIQRTALASEGLP